MATVSSDSPKAPGRKEPAGDAHVHYLLCKSCGLCAEYCPYHLPRPASDVPDAERTGPSINPAGHAPYEIYDPEGRCTGCGICGNICPEGAIVVYRKKKPAAAAGGGPSPRPALPTGEGTENGKEAGHA